MPARCSSRCRSADVQPDLQADRRAVRGDRRPLGRARECVHADRSPSGTALDDLDALASVRAVLAWRDGRAELHDGTQDPRSDVAAPSRIVSFQCLMFDDAAEPGTCRRAHVLARWRHARGPRGANQAAHRRRREPDPALQAARGAAHAGLRVRPPDQQPGDRCRARGSGDRRVVPPADVHAHAAGSATRCRSVPRQRVAGEAPRPPRGLSVSPAPQDLHRDLPAPVQGTSRSAMRRALVILPRSAAPRPSGTPSRRRTAPVTSPS